MRRNDFTIKNRKRRRWLDSTSRRSVLAGATYWPVRGLSVFPVIETCARFAHCVFQIPSALNRRFRFSLRVRPSFLAHGTRDRHVVVVVAFHASPPLARTAADRVENEEQKCRRRATGLLPQDGAQHHTVPSSTLHPVVFYRITPNDALPSKMICPQRVFRTEFKRANSSAVRIRPLRVGRSANVRFYSYFFHSP